MPDCKNSATELKYTVEGKPRTLLKEASAMTLMTSGVIDIFVSTDACCRTAGVISWVQSVQASSGHLQPMLAMMSDVTSMLVKLDMFPRGPV